MNIVWTAARNRCWLFRGHFPSALRAARWVIAAEELDWLMDALDTSPHVPVASPAAIEEPAAHLAR